MRTIYCHFHLYVAHWIQKEAKKRGFVVKELTLKSKPKKGDVVIYSEVSSYRTFRRFIQILKLWMRGVPLLMIQEEPSVVLPYNHLRILHLPFKRVYTWNVKNVNGKRWIWRPTPRRFWKQFLGLPDRVKPIPYEKKKFLTIMSANKRPFTYWFPGMLQAERVRAQRFFDDHLEKGFDIYGAGLDRPFSISDRLFGLRPYSSWRGFVKYKNKTMAGYKFCICYENCIQKGYITEKIFDAFECRCVPIYLGTEEIRKHVPARCYINKNDFPSYESLLAFLQNMDRKRYEQYIQHINAYLESNRAKEWNPEAFLTQLFTDVEALSAGHAIV